VPIRNAIPMSTTKYIPATIAACSKIIELDQVFDL
jgi:hypothetical protein